MTTLVQKTKNKISGCYITGPILSTYWTRPCPQWSRTTALEDFLVVLWSAFWKHCLSFSLTHFPFYFGIIRREHTPQSRLPTKIARLKSGISYQSLMVTFLLNILSCAINLLLKLRTSLRSVCAIKTCGRYSHSTALSHGQCDLYTWKQLQTGFWKST